MDTGDCDTQGGPSTLPCNPPRNNIFYHEDHDMGLRFHIQKDLRESLIRMLAGEITLHGGQIITKVPLRGYVLLDSNSHKGMLLKHTWDDAEKTDRHVLCYTYVPACVFAKKLLPPNEFKVALPIFIHENDEVTFYLEPHLEDRVRDDVSLSIIKAGGQIVSSINQARVIIADPATKHHRNLIRKYEHESEVFVESPEWVEECIKRNKYKHVVEVRVVGGRKSGATRTEYTIEDDQNLIEYIGKRLPYRHMHGRTGNEVFKALCDRTDLYPWASRHTWESWRNRYKKNRDRLDADIDAYVRRNPPDKTGNGQYLVKRSKASTSQVPKDSDEDEDESDENSLQSDAESSRDAQARYRKRRRTTRPEGEVE